ncbi:maintenance of telomere capping protein 1 [Stachybotrys elegans]|uniref:Maintenance of telomere capping protein 1 n=1 Tax=Stachybotrys elegans TaxID=80388 RepID=A0A8K0WPL5_9HYPO|nr:maintenance of telomere capping protein 1 [Stachybotrys elegans]
MATKKTKAPAADDIDELFSGIDVKPAASKTPKPTSAASKAMGNQDILADLESQLAAQEISRPHTPRVKDAAGKRSTATPPIPDAARKSTDSARSLKASFTPSATSSEPHESEKKGPVEQNLSPAQEPLQAQQSGGGWWGGILSTANAAMKQAEAAYKEIQHNEEAKKWAEQVKGLRTIDVGALKNYGDELRQRALPTFTNILHTIAPPISSHERLLIHITHDLVGYPSLDPLVHDVFARVMSQVEGGDLLVVQRGHESGSRRSHDVSAGWRDGPWWRQSDAPRQLGLIKGLTEGTKLCRANAEAYSLEYFAASGGLEQAKIRATEAVSESNPVRTSDIFLAVQAISYETDKTLFASTAAAEKDKESTSVKEQDAAEENVQFAIFILDPVHEIEFSALSQTIPAKWIRWLDSSDIEGEESTVPEEIQDVLETGGVDPREWVAEWVEETLGLSIGIVAQRYVARRMGVGEGGLGRGKRRVEDVIQDNAGEAARAGLM